MVPTSPFRSIRDRFRRWLSKDRTPLEYVPTGWQRLAIDRRIKGWDVSSVSTTQAAKLDGWRGLAASNRPLGSNVGEQNTLLAFAYAAALAASQSKLSLLDWGGGVGQYGDLAKAVLPGVNVAYYCKEVPSQCELGRELSPESVFFESDDEFIGNTYDLVLASGSIQYVQDWRALLAMLARATRKYLFVTRLPVVLKGDSYVVLQRAYQHGYDTEYLGWRLNRDEFLRVAKCEGLSLFREFLLAEDEWARNAPYPAFARGFLFRSESRFSE